jgi:flagellar basal body-associated protein FliL
MSRRFWLILIVLLLVITAACVGTVSFVLNNATTKSIPWPIRSDSVLATNTKVQEQIYATQTAKAWTKTPSPIN